MHEPAHLPRSEADLDDWSVFADHLIERGDPRGELIACDLAVPARPTREEVAAFHLQAKRLCPTHSSHVGTTWTLGFIRELHLHATHQQLRPRIERGAIGRVEALLHTDATRFLEVFVLDYLPPEAPTHMRRMFAALPPSCTTVVVDAYAPFDAAHLAQLIGWLPATVRTLRLHRVRAPFDAATTAVLVTDRFDVIDISHPLHRAAHPRNLATANRVRLRVRAASTADAANPRVLVGAPGDARLAFPAFVVALRRPRLVDLQPRVGVVAIRAWLARTFRESHAVDVSRPAELAVTYGHTLVHEDDRWTVQPETRRLLTIDDVPVTDLRELPDGATLAIDGVAGRFTATIPDR